MYDIVGPISRKLFRSRLKKQSLHLLRQLHDIPDPREKKRDKGDKCRCDRGHRELLRLGKNRWDVQSAIVAFRPPQVREGESSLS